MFALLIMIAAQLAAAHPGTAARQPPAPEEAVGTGTVADPDGAPPVPPVPQRSRAESLSIITESLVLPMRIAAADKRRIEKELRSMDGAEAALLSTMEQKYTDYVPVIVNAMSASAGADVDAMRGDIAARMKTGFAQLSDHHLASIAAMVAPLVTFMTPRASNPDFQAVAAAFDSPEAKKLMAVSRSYQEGLTADPAGIAAFETWEKVVQSVEQEVDPSRSVRGCQARVQMRRATIDFLAGRGANDEAQALEREIKARVKPCPS